MSIVIQEDQLKGFPDNRLAQLLENPVSEFPPYLVYAELNRRKDLRNRYAQQQAEAPSSTMAEEMVAEVSGIGQAMPPQMMPPGAIPPGAMPTQMMSGGGLVRGFSDGSGFSPISAYEGYSPRGGGITGGNFTVDVRSPAERRVLDELEQIDYEVSIGKIDPELVQPRKYELLASLSGSQSMYVGKPGFSAVVPRVPVLSSIGTSLYEMADESKAKAEAEQKVRDEALAREGLERKRSQTIDRDPSEAPKFRLSEGVRQIEPSVPAVDTESVSTPDQPGAGQGVSVTVPETTATGFLGEAKGRMEKLQTKADEAGPVPTVGASKINRLPIISSDLNKSLSRIRELQGSKKDLFRDIKNLSTGISTPNTAKLDEARLQLSNMSDYPGIKAFDDYIKALEEDKGRDSSSIDKLRERLEELTPAPNKDVTTGMALLGLGRGLLSAPTFAEGLAAGIPDVQQAVTARQQDLKDYNKNRQLAEQALFDVEEERSRRREDRMFQARTAGLDVQSRAASFGLDRAKALSDIEIAKLNAENQAHIAKAGILSDAARMEADYETKLARLEADVVTTASSLASQEARDQARLNFDAESLTAKLKGDERARAFKAVRDAQDSYLAAETAVYSSDSNLARSVLNSLGDSIDELREQRQIYITLDQQEEVGKLDNAIRLLSQRRDVVLERFSPKRLAVPTPER